MFKKWSIGDLAKSDAFDGNTTYNVIEAFNTNDRVSKKDLARPLRNVFENSQESFDFLENWSYFTSMNNGIIKDALISEFEFSGDSDIVPITIDPGTGDTTEVYLRLSPGVAMNRGKLAINRPTTHIAERQLDEIFNLESWGVEGTEIKYYYNVDLFQARIKRKNINGTIVNHDFLNGGTWGDSDGGYSTGIELLEAIYTDTVYFRDDFADAVGVDLLQINLEPTIAGDSGDTYYWHVDRNGNFIGADSVAGDSWALNLYTISVAIGGDSSDYWSDSRTYIQNYNDFSTYMFLNVPQEWGDTDTVGVSDPYEDTTLDYSQISNQDTLLVFLRKSSGDTYDSSIFGWKETNVADISETRSDVFWMNKDLIVNWGAIDKTGDTLGAQWASIKEMSGDSWTFYGNKIFEDGAHEFRSEDTTADSFKIDTKGGVDIDTNEGLTINDDSGSSFEISAIGDMTLSAIGDMALNAAGDSINIDTANLILDATSFMDVNVTGNLDIDASGSILLTGDSFLLTASTGTIGINTNGAVNIDTPNGQDVSITAGASESSSDVNITAYRDVIITAAGDSIAFISNTLDFTVTTMDLNLTTFDLDTTGQINLTSSQAAGNALRFYASNAAGGIDIDAGTNGVSIVTTGGLVLDPATNLAITGNTVTINILGELDIDTNTGFFVNDDSGGAFTISNTGAVALTSASNQAVVITGTGATSGDVQINSGGTADILLDASANEIDLTATLIDINVGAGGFDLDVTSGNVNVNSNTIELNAVGDIILDAGGADIDLKDDGTRFGTLTNSSGQLRIRSGATPTTVLTFSGANTVFSGAVTGVTSLTVDNIVLNTNTLTSTGTFIIDSSIDIDLNADGGDVFLKDAAVTYGSLTNTSGNLIIKSGTTTALTFSGANASFAGTITGTIAASNVTEISNLTAVEGAQLENINNVTISNTQWGYLGASNQGIATSNSVSFAQVTVDNMVLNTNTLTSTGTFIIDSSVDIDLNADGGDVFLKDAAVTYGSLTNASGNLIIKSGTTTALTFSGANTVMSGYLAHTTNPTYSKLDYTADASAFAGSNSVVGLAVTGSFAAYKVYNAVWNDYAEGFEFDKNAGKPAPGFIYKQTKNGVIKTNKRAEKATIGVCSDSYGMLIGSEDCYLWDADEEYNKNKTKIPIALAGKVKPWVREKIEIGDVLVAGKDGFATKATLFDRVFRQDSIIGKALEISCCKAEKRIWILVK